MDPHSASCGRLYANESRLTVLSNSFGTRLLRELDIWMLCLSPRELCSGFQFRSKSTKGWSVAKRWSRQLRLLRGLVRNTAQIHSWTHCTTRESYTRAARRNLKQLCTSKQQATSMDGLLILTIAILVLEVALEANLHYSVCVGAYWA